MFFLIVVACCIIGIAIGPFTDEQLLRSYWITERWNKTFSDTMFYCRDGMQRAVVKNGEMVTIQLFCNITFVEPFVFQDCQQRTRTVEHNPETRSILLVEECGHWVPEYSLDDYLSFSYAFTLIRIVLCLCAILIGTICTWALIVMISTNYQHCRTRLWVFITRRKRVGDYL